MARPKIKAIDASKAPLLSRAVVVELFVNRPGQDRVDQNASGSVTTAMNAKQGRARVVKKIMGDWPLYKELDALFSEIKAYHLENTLPWGNERNKRILLSKHYLDYTNAMRTYDGRVQAIVARMAADWQNMLHADARDLGNLFNTSDYVDAGDISDVFSVRFRVSQLQDPNDWRVEIPDEFVDEIKAKAVEEFKEGQAAVLRDPWMRVYALLKDFLNRLESPERRHWGEMHAHFVELYDLLPVLNLDNDADLGRMREDIFDKFITVAPEEIRNSPAIRERMIAHTKAAMEQTDQALASMGLAPASETKDT